MTCLNFFVDGAKVVLLHPAFIIPREACAEACPVCVFNPGSCSPDALFCAVAGSTQLPINTTAEIMIDKDMSEPVYVYYVLRSFYQNHKRYVRSVNFDQLHGKSNSAGAECDPESQLNGKTINPCGLQAWATFNDSFTDFAVRDTCHPGCQMRSNPLSSCLRRDCANVRIRSSSSQFLHLLLHRSWSSNTFRLQAPAVRRHQLRWTKRIWSGAQTVAFCSPTILHRTSTLCRRSAAARSSP